MKKDFSQIKHPLIQAFGLSLKALRRNESKKADRAAKELGVGESLYRLLESGSAVLQPNKALALIKTFPSARIDFARLATLLVIFQVIAENRPSTHQAALDQALELAQISNEGEELFRILGPVWDEISKFADSRTVGSKIEKNDIPRLLLLFLAHRPPIADTPLNLRWINNQIAATPPLFLDLASKLIGGLNQYSQLMNVKSVDDWETQHRNRIRSQYAVVKSLDDILATCDEFNWDFLGEERFAGLQLICYGHSEERKKERAKLGELKKRILDKATVGGKDPKLAARIDDSLALVFVEDKEIIKLIERNLVEETTQTECEHVWLYELSPEVANVESGSLSESYYVAIMDNRKGKDKVYSCIHCSTSQTQNWVDLIKKTVGKDGASDQ